MTEEDLSPESGNTDETIVGDSFLAAIVRAGSSPRVPDKIGNFTIVRELGRGGMGVVYEAEEEILGRRVAIKALPSAFATNPVARKRFEHEARILASMNHPSIGTIFQLREIDGDLYLILELISGESLGERIERGPLSVAETVEVCVQITLAVEGAHERGVIHRDLKPENVMITDENKVKVLDFGLAIDTPAANQRDRPAPPAAGAGATPDAVGASHDELEGTPAYMSPEQVYCAAVDERVDVWGLGCILFECLAGRRAFDQDDVWAVLEQIIEGEPDWSSLPTNLPPKLVSLVRGCLTKKPEERIASIADVRQRLQNSVANAASPALRTNLPDPLTRIVGREDDMAAIEILLADARSVTLTGTGGCGKTVLAYALGRSLLHAYPDGVWCVELSSLVEPSRIAPSILMALGLESKRGRDPLQAMISHLADQTVLLIVDNCEHVLQSCSEVISQLLKSCGGLKVLATSREGLGVRGGVTYPVPSLAVPAPGETIRVEDIPRFPAVRLFIDRALAARPGEALTPERLELIVSICRQLDGIPLAIELAAARARVLPLERIAQLLDDRFRLLLGPGGTALPRQQTLRALIDWSYDQLGDDEKQLLRTLGVFRGSFTLDAAVKVHGGDDPDEFLTLDLLTRLVEKSLVQTEERLHEFGYRLLETIRQYSVDRMMEAGEAAELRRRHLHIFAALTREATQHTDGPQSQAWAQRLELEHENLREALSWAAGDPALGDVGLQMALCLIVPWTVRGHLLDGRQALEVAIANVAEPADRDLALCLDGLARFDLELGNLQPARERQEHAVSMWRQLDDPERLGMSLVANGNVLWRLGDLDEAERVLEEATVVTGELEKSAARLGAVRNLAIVAYRRGDLPKGARRIDVAISEARAVDDRETLSLSLQLAGVIQMRLERYEEARASHEEAMHLMEELGFKSGVAMQLINLGSVALSQQDPDRAEALYSDALKVAREVGRKMTVVEALGSLGECRDQQGDAEGALVFYRQVLDLCREMGEVPVLAKTLERLAELSVKAGDLDTAEDYACERVRRLYERSANRELGEALRDWATLSRQRGDPRSATQLLALAETTWAQERVTDEQRAELDQLKGELRQGMGAGEFDEAWETGLRATLQELLSP